MTTDKASADYGLVRVCKVVTPGRGGVEHKSFLQLRFTLNMQKTGYGVISCGFAMIAVK